MTKDPALKRTCQRAIDFICHAQHNGGGWRYFPGQPGDMTVFGWQFMALKSGQLAKRICSRPRRTLMRSHSTPRRQGRSGKLPRRFVVVGARPPRALTTR